VQKAPASTPKQKVGAVPFGSSYVGDGYKVTIKKVSITKPTMRYDEHLGLFKSRHGQISIAPNTVLLVQISVENTDDRAILNYLGMRTDGSQTVFTLFDDVDNQLRAIYWGTHSPGLRVAKAMTKGQELYPNTVATHAEAFQVPTSKTKSLRFVMLGQAFGKDGVATFDIPVDQIQGF
jgi:hypothetical protein